MAKNPIDGGSDLSKSEDRPTFDVTENSIRKGANRAMKAFTSQDPFKTEAMPSGGIPDMHSYLPKELQTDFIKAGHNKSPMKGSDKMEMTMHEFKHGTLHSGSKKGPKVTSRKQAIAIGLSQQRKANK